MYAPLCLASDDVRRCIKPDYGNKTTLDVYTSVAQYCLAQPSANLDFLGYAKLCGTETARRARSSFLSWVPDFSSSLELVPIPKILHFPSQEKRHVGFTDQRGVPKHDEAKVAAYSPLGDTPNRSFIEDREFHVTGVYIDVLEDNIQNVGPDLEAIRAVAYKKGGHWATESNHKYTTTGGSWMDAMNRALVLDVMYDYLERPSERGGKQDSAFLKETRNELTPVEYRYQLSMQMVRANAMKLRNLGLSQKKYLLIIPDSAEVGD